MDIKDFFQKVSTDIAKGNYDQLRSYQLEKPENFNWVKDIFEPTIVEKNPDSHALIWRYKDQDRFFSFKEMMGLANQLINLLRKHGIQKGDHIYSQLPLVPANWISVLATIKGGFITMPTATNLTARDVAYRFETLFPQVMIADETNAAKIDEAEAGFDQNIKLKIIVNGSRLDGFLLTIYFKKQPKVKPKRPRRMIPFCIFSPQVLRVCLR